MARFKVRDKVLIKSVPLTITAYRRSLKKLVHKVATVIDMEHRDNVAITGMYFLVVVQDKEVWLHEMNLELVE
jgi:hypothetical protein